MSFCCTAALGKSNSHTIYLAYCTGVYTIYHNRTRLPEMQYMATPGFADWKVSGGLGVPIC